MTGRQRGAPQDPLGLTIRQARRPAAVPRAAVISAPLGVGAGSVLGLTRWSRRQSWTDPDGAVRDSEYGFLVGRVLDTATLARAERLARRWSLPPHAVLLALGWVTPEGYVRALAEHLGVATAPAASLDHAERRLRPPFVATATVGERRLAVVNAMAAGPAATASAVHRAGVPRETVALASADALKEAALRRASRSMLRAAIWGLARRAPELSATRPAASGQLAQLAAVCGMMLGVVLVLPEMAGALWLAVMVLPFLAVAALRLAALAIQLTSPPKGPRRSAAPRLPDALLPIYTVLVPLYREGHMLPGLVTALQRLDYPAAKLDIRIVLEAADEATCRMAEQLDLPAHISVVVVPDAHPRTKPKALNYAVQLARGSFVVVFDAEDAPEPTQLRAAVDAFRAASPDVACVQAALNIHNRNSGWLPRQFALEYSALFDALLPCLVRLGLPVPLGGTSNHFRADALAAVGGWDPFNVTEDADLGIRLHRRGWRTLVIPSTTYEEAPHRFGTWLRQRTRWIKGWMQTYLVHTRSHRLLVREGGWSGWLGVQVLLGGVILSCLLHPVFYATLLVQALFLGGVGPPPTPVGHSLWIAAMLNLAVGLGASMSIAAVAAWRRGWRRLALHALAMPAYWLLISLAAYRALWQLFRDPFLWEKTDHGHHPAAQAPSAGPPQSSSKAPL